MALYSIPLLVVLLVIVILIVILFTVYMGVIGKRKFKKEAEEQMRIVRLSNPEISCDYCATKIDTSKYKYCPHCGADYEADSEWSKRQNADSKAKNDR